MYITLYYPYQYKDYIPYGIAIITTIALGEKKNEYLSCVQLKK